MTEITDPREQRLKAAFAASQEPGSEACPSAEKLAALVLAEIPGGEREAVAEHAVTCRRCSRDLKILFATHEEAGGRPSFAPRRALTLGLAAAAAVALVALFLPVLLRKSSGPGAGEETLRSGSASDSARLVSPPPDARLLEAPGTLAWPPAAGDSSYTVKLFDASGTALWESSALEAPRVTVPAEVRARLVAGSSYFWVVTAERPVGPERRGPYPFSVRAR